MAGTTPPFAPIDQQAWVIGETTFDTAISNTSASAFAFNELKIDPEYAFHPSKEFQGTATLVTEIPAMRGGKWSLLAYMKPTAVNTRPNIDAIIAAGFGQASALGGSSVTYALAENINLPPSLQISRQAGAALYEVMNGAWVESIEAEIVGNQEPVFRISGGFSSYGAIRGQPITDASSHGAGASTVPLAAASHDLVVQFGGAQPRVQFTGDTNGGTGYAVTAVSSDGLTLSISPNLAVGIAASAVVTPLLPAYAPTGTVLGGVTAGLTIDALAVAMISAKVKLETGFAPRNKEATSNRPTGLVRGMRHVTGEMSFYAMTDSLPPLNAAWNAALHNLAIRCGANVAGQRVRLNVPNARFDVSSIPLQGEKDAAMITGKFVGRRSAANGDELNYVLD